MAETKFGHLMKEIPAFKDYGAGYYRQGTEMDGSFFGYDLNVRYGTFYHAGKIQPYQTQVADYDQMFIFMGADTYDMGYLGAEVDFCIGEEKEKHKITVATAVSVPKGLPYGPISIGPMDDRFILLQVAMTAKLNPRPVLQDKPEGPYAPWRFGKYSQNFEELAFIRNGPWHYGPLNPDTNGGYITNINGKGFSYNMSYESMMQAPYRFTPDPEKPHVHPYTEFLMFIGCNCDNLGELPAEVEVCMGEEMETHPVTRPTVAIQPKGHPHCPVRVLKQSEPWIFIVLRPWGHGGDLYSGGEATRRENLR